MKRSFTRVTACSATVALAIGGFAGSAHAISAAVPVFNIVDDGSGYLTNYADVSAVAGTYNITCSGGQVYVNGHIASGAFDALELDTSSGNDTVTAPSLANCPTRLQGFSIVSSGGNDTVSSSTAPTGVEADGGHITATMALPDGVVDSSYGGFVPSYAFAAGGTVSVTLDARGQALTEDSTDGFDDYWTTGYGDFWAFSADTTVNPTPGVTVINGTVEISATGPIDNSVPPVDTPHGYWLLQKDGRVLNFGNTTVCDRSVTAVPSPQKVISNIDGTGYYVLDSQSGYLAPCNAYQFGSAAPGYSNLPKLSSGEFWSTASITPSGQGAILFTNKGRAAAIGDAKLAHDSNNASMPTDLFGRPLNGPIIDSVMTPTGKGYFMIGSDGGVFCFGDAVFYGSMGGKKLNGPVIGVVPFSSNNGYWLDATDGGVFTFPTNSGKFYGSMGGKKLNQPMVGMVPYGSGYVMAASDGGVFDFSGTSGFYGSGVGKTTAPVISVAATPSAI